VNSLKKRYGIAKSDEKQTGGGVGDIARPEAAEGRNEDNNYTKDSALHIYHDPSASIGGEVDLLEWDVPSR
jgi:hypothetical protein